MLIKQIGTDYRVKFKNNNLTNSKAPLLSNDIAPKQSYATMTSLNYQAFMPNFKSSTFSPLSFEETIKTNFFQLPQYKDENGEMVQAVPDKTQLEAAESLYIGDSTLCIAPTGTGKTAIANYIITKNLESGKKTFYTTPLKALSNDKYREFCKLYGQDNVGLLTGDIKMNAKAPVVIMTTEIFRNMALSQYANPGKDKFKNVATVVFDEAHYLNDEDRGNIWEESIMFMPENIQVLMLSATVGNGKELSGWVDKTTHKDTNLVESSPKNRHVPLVYYNYSFSSQNPFRELLMGRVNPLSLQVAHEEGKLSERQTRGLDFLKNKAGLNDKEILEKLVVISHYGPLPHDVFFSKIQKEFELSNIEAMEITQLLIDSDSKQINPQSVNTTPNESIEQFDYVKIVKDMAQRNILPAIIFKFSRKGCNEAARHLASNVDLTSKDDKQEITAILRKYQDNGIYLGKDFSIEQIKKGIGVHHAGLLPGNKKLVEELFSKKLLKVVFATSTLGAGINMPAKTVVVTELEHPSADNERVPLEANEFHQMVGRAGRRGIDKIGNVILYNLGVDDMHLAQKLVLQKADSIESKYKLSPGFLVSYYQQNETDEKIDKILSKTLKVYQDKSQDMPVLSDLKKEYVKLRKLLLSLGYLEETEQGFKSTIKGQMLARVHGYNELTLVEMIKNKELDNLQPDELVSFASSMINSNLKMSEFKMELVSGLMEELCENNNSETVKTLFSKATMYDDKLAKVEEDNEVDALTNETDGLSAYIGYKWANSVQMGDDSIEVFNNLLTSNTSTDKRGNPKTYDCFKNIFDGSLYSILSQSVDVLKQVINICEFACEQESLQEDLVYYSNLKQNASKAIELLKYKPLYDSLSIS